MSAYSCCDQPRRSDVLADPSLNGIDFVEVVDDPGDPLDLRQRTLLVRFLKPLAPAALGPKNVRIEGGERIRNIQVVDVSIGVSSPLLSPVASPLVGDPRVLTVVVSTRGDFSLYTLRIVSAPGSDVPPAGFDPVLSAVSFSFKVNCPSDFDCKPVRTCPDDPVTAPEINYLAKDYATFRQAMLDRMAVLAPAWQERSPADIGIALVELLSYVGDRLSYRQDAIATETYLTTARRRASVRRHARLVDYPVHDGRNARVWIHVEVGTSGDGLTLTAGSGPDRTKFLTRTDALAGSSLVPFQAPAFQTARAEQPQVFELLHDCPLHAAHNEMRFYTFGAGRCCLPKGSRKAVLDGSFPNLRKGDVLLFVEKRGPETGIEQDADAGHRHAVRLTRVTPETDPLGNRPITTIEWDRADALPFPLCVSAVVDAAPFTDVGVALGNIALADHGMTVSDVFPAPPVGMPAPSSLDPDQVPPENPALVRPLPSNTTRCRTPEVLHPPLRYRPRLTKSPLTHATPYDAANPPATASAATDLSFEDPDELPIPAIRLFDPSDLTAAPWTPVRDLLASGPLDTQFVVEVETDGSTYLRFGDGTHGEAPQRGQRFLAEYRLGHGTSGNIGAGVIRHIVSNDPSFVTGGNTDTILGVTNPMAAVGGVDPETIEHVRQNAPTAFRRLERAVTTADYETLAVRKDVVERCGLDIQRVAATRRWTGSWYTVFLTADRVDGAAVDGDFEQKLRDCLERYRMAGQDLEIDAPRPVSLELELALCVRPPYFFNDVAGALRDVLSNRTLPDGRRGLFHPDNYTFGQSVHLSEIYAAAQAVTGVDSLVVTTFQRQGIDSDVALKAGRLDLGRLEIARLDADPNFPERGALRITRG